MLASKKAFNKYFPDCNKKAVKDGLKSLKGIRKLLSDEERWLKGDFEKVNPETKNFQYCLLGASREVDGPGEVLADRIMIAVLDSPVMEFNDAEDTTHKDILKLLDRSIKFGEKLLEYAPAKIKKEA